MADKPGVPYSDPQYVPFKHVIREVAREEIASLAGLILRRLQLESEGFVDSTGAVVDIRLLEQIFGEVLRDFGATPDEPGDPA